MTGATERLNRTLQDKARTLMTETNVLKMLWGKAITYAAYQLNRSPTSALGGGIPAERYLGAADISKMCIFGSKARMIGYAPSGYRLWNPFTGEICISKKVKFDEMDINYEDNNNRNKITYEIAETDKINEEKEILIEEQSINKKTKRFSLIMKKMRQMKWMEK